MRFKLLFLIVPLLLLSCGLITDAPAEELIVCISFDDQDYSIYEYALPILERYGVRATSFINSGLIGLPQKLSRTQVCTLENTYGWETGGHTLTHTELSTLTPEQANQEIQGDYEQLKSWGINPQSFALPKGHCPEYLYQTIRTYYSNIRGSSDFAMKQPLNRYALGYMPWQTGWTHQQGIDRILRGVANGESLIIIGFHKVQPGDTVSITNCEPEELELLMQWLSEHQIRTLPLNEAIETLQR